MNLNISKYKTRQEELQSELSRPETSSDPEKLSRLGKELSEVEEIVNTFEKIEKLEKELRSAEDLREETAEMEMTNYLEREIIDLKDQMESLTDILTQLTRPVNPEDKKNAIIEIRAGAGGDEAALFAGDLFRMYTMFAQSKDWQVEQLNSNPGTTGGFKEIVALFSGSNAYGNLKFESGVHRVQRVPATESSGRIHTSTATVAVLPEQTEVEIEIKSEDLRIDVYRSSGPGGQSVNTTDSAVRVTHLPTGIVVSCQDQKSQLKNKEAALRILKSRLYEMEQERLAKERGDKRRSQIGTGERSEKIRTYNFPQDRVTDHRVKKSWHNLPKILSGDLSPIIQGLKKVERESQTTDE